MLQDSSLTAFVQSLPKTETHLHVEGALPYELLRAWKPGSFPALPAFRERGHRYATFAEFDQELLGHALPWFTSAERYHESAKAMFARHVAENVKYVETSFHLAMTQLIGVPGPEIIAAIRAAVPPGLEVRIFTGMLRSEFSGALRPTIDRLHAWDGLAGVDLHGLESAPVHSDTAKVWARLRAAGKETKCHAGEFDGAARVREAIEQLGVTRVQHGVRAIEDPGVVELAVDRGVTFDMCPLSNVGLRVVPDMPRHPLRKLLDAGIRCTISTDDPLCFGNSVNEEYLAISHGLGFSRPELVRIARNGFEVALMSDAQKQPWFAQLDAMLSGKDG